MTPTRFSIECDLARYALGLPAGAVEAWECGEILQGHVTTDTLAASLAAAVVYVGKPADKQTELTLCRLARAALIDADAWTDSLHDEADWYSPVWGPLEVASAVGAGFIGFGGFDERMWLGALEAFFPFARSEAV